MIKLFLPFCLLLTLAAGAQIKEGKILYERTMQMRTRSNEAMQEMLPATRKDVFELLFANNQSLWQAVPNAVGESNNFSAPGIEIRMGGMNDVTYHNFVTGKKVEDRELFDRNFVIEDSVQKLAWKLTGETKTILNYPAQKATTQRISSRMQMTMENGVMKREQIPDTSTVTAWFTSAIPVSVGPQEFQGQLPGAILELELNRGRTIYQAIEFSAKVNAASIKEPKKGKRLTPKEFVAEREKLMEEMRKNQPANGNRVFRMNQ